MNTKRAKIKTLQPDSHNANRGTDRGREAVAESLSAYGAGRSVLVDKHGAIIAGNKTVEAAGLAGIENALVVETDGSEIVVVKRTDLDLSEDKARQLAYADNRSAQLGIEWDADVIAADVASGLDIPGFTEGEINALVGFPDDADGKDLDESIADDVKTVTCPDCGREIPV